jgi:subtilisin-like proprotein convertase family protein
VATITTLSPFANFTIPSGSFPADVEIIPSDPVHVYELMNTGAVKSYTTSGTAAFVSTVTPPTGETWTDMAVDPTTGTVYALSSNSACTAAKLFTVNLLAGTSTQVGATTISGCMVGLGADNGGNLFGHNIAADSLMSINKATGAGATVGPVGFDGNFGQSMDCDPGSGTCYLFAFNNTAFRGELRSLNLGTGASTLVGVIGQTAPGGTVQISGAVFGTFGQCQVDADCNDGNVCNGLETCDAGSGNCIPGTPVTCNDGDPCTVDQCDPPTGTCNFPPVVCTDGNACNGLETCDPGNGACLPGTPVTCDDSDPCTLNVCDTSTGSCSFPADACSDGDPCTIDSCDPVNGCQHDAPGLVRLCNSGSIGIPAGAPGTTSGPGSPYPSNIVAGGLSTNSSLCSVELRGMSHTFPGDIDILLVGPAGGAQNAIIMSDVGGGNDITAVDLVLTDGAASPLPTSGTLVSGSYQPTNSGTGDTFPAPAPAPAGGSSLNVFAGNPNGTWSLYIQDDAGGDTGSVSGGWCVNIVQSFCTSDNDCNDGNLCNGVETCDTGSGQCSPGTPVNCDDGNQCTADACVPATGACTHAANPCSDNDGCTVDSCDPVNGCQHTAQTPVIFCNTNVITIPSSGNGSPYPSAIPVSGVGPRSSLCSVSLRGLTHTFPDDLDMLLVGPAGGTQNTIMLSDAGGSADAVSVDLTFKDTAAAGIPDGGPMVSGTFKPTNIGTGDTFPAPAPAPQGGTTPNFNAFTGDLNGTWNLFVVDDASGDLGNVGGWCVAIVIGSCGSNADCDDGNACNGAETCVNTQCTPGTPVDCTDGNPCTDDHCSPGDGSCFYTATNCSDSSGCTVDTCDPATGCQHSDRCIEVCTPRIITIPGGTGTSGPADPYPTDLSVNIGPVNGVFSLGAVKLLGFTHTFPGDVDVMLSGPGGQNATILSTWGRGTTSATSTSP